MKQQPRNAVGSQLRARRAGRIHGHKMAGNVLGEKYLIETFPNSS